MSKIRFTAAARREFLEAIDWYDAARAGLGRQSIAAVEAAAACAAAFPAGGALADGATRRMVLNGFPFSLFYKQHGRSIVIHALAHHARRPAYWQSEARE